MADAQNPRDATGAWRLETASDGVAVLELDVPGRPINVLTSAVLAELESVLARAAGDTAVKAVVLANGKRDSGTFIAGADIDEIRGVNDPTEAASLARRGQEVLGLLSTMPKPTVAAIDGVCLGGGTELVLACDFRIAADDERVDIGLPEVLLGIIPGFGGTQRLPRLIGIRPALDLILTGKRVGARKAALLGLVDRVAPPSLLREEAVALAREALGHGKRWRPGKKRRVWSDPATLFLEGTGWGRRIIRGLTARAIRAKTGERYPAPFKALHAVVEGYPKPLPDGLRLEAELVGGLVASQTTKNILGIFQATEALRRRPRGERPEELHEGTACKSAAQRAFREVLVLGAGVMGGSIAALLARRRFRVRLKDLRLEALATALRQAARSFDELVARRRMTRRERENALAAISATTSNTFSRRVEMALEAVVEDLEVKRHVLREIEPLLPADALFASNTSSLSINALAEAATRPERVVGLHFFNPVHRMPLVEVVQGERTSPEALAAAEAMARDLGKYPLRVKDGPGFLVNRLLLPYLNESAYLASEGRPFPEIDRAMKDFGFPMGPFELLDEVGLDVVAKVARILHAAFGERATPAPILERITAEGKFLGKKGGAGFYLHRGKRQPNPAVMKLLGRSQQGPPSPEERSRWEERLIYPMVNEAARCLEEGIVASAAEVDAGTAMGMAFPPFRGGLCTYADQTGTRAVAAALEALASQAGTPAAAERFRPSALLQRLASSNRSFAAVSAERPEQEPQPAHAGAGTGLA